MLVTAVDLICTQQVLCIVLFLYVIVFFLFIVYCCYYYTGSDTNCGLCTCLDVFGLWIIVILGVLQFTFNLVTRVWCVHF